MSEFESKIIPIGKLVNNTGQIEGLPRNPRKVTDEELERTKRNIQEFPDMLGYRDLSVYAHGKNYVVVCGNQRLTAMRQLGHKECYCTIIPQGTSPEKLRAYATKDNLSYGVWNMDLLANEYDPKVNLQELGIDTSAWDVKIQDFQGGGGEIDIDDFKEEMQLKVILSRDEAEWLKEKMRTIHPQAEKAIMQQIELNENEEDEE